MHRELLDCAQKRPIHALLAPTGSGKTKMAIDWALKNKGIIYSLDSVSVYQELNIGSAKPKEEELKGIPYRLINLVSVEKELTVKAYIQYFLECLRKEEENRPILITGGSFFYFNALVYGMFEAPPSDGSIEAEIDLAIKEHSLESVYLELKKIEEEFWKNESESDRNEAKKIFEKLHPHDEYRIVRAMTVFKMTQKPMSYFKLLHAREKRDQHQLNQFPIKMWTINRPREVLYERINVRVKEMLQDGLIEEVRMLMQKGFHYSKNKPLKAVGYYETALYLEGAMGSIEELEYTIALNTRHYAKRQLTFLKSIPQKLNDFETLES